MSEPFGPGSLACLFFLFVCWLGAVIGWGCALVAAIGLRSASGVSRSEALALTLGLGSLLAAGWGYAGVAIQRGSTLSSAVFLLGGALALALFGSWPSTGMIGKRGHALLVGLMGAYVVFRFVQGTRLARHGDPFYYHLVAPVLWVRNGLAFDPSHPFSYQASTWEGLYLWPAKWLLGFGDVGLPAIQIFAQWIHLSIGWVGMGLAVVALQRRLRVPPIPSLLGGFAALATRSLWWTGALAKNDCGVSLWLLSGAVLLFARKPTLRACLAAGMLVGASFVGKYTTLFLTLPLLAAWGFDRLRREPKGFLRLLGVFVLGSIVAGGPFLLRNWIGTGTPVFPIPFASARSGGVSQSSHEYLEGIAPSGINTELGWRLERLTNLAGEGPLAILILVAPVLLWPRKAGSHRHTVAGHVSIVFLAGLASLVLFLIVAKPGTELRLLGPGLAMASAAGAVIAVLILRNLRRFRRLAWLPAGMMTLLAIALTCRLAPEAVFDRIREFPMQQEISRHTGGDTKAWIAKNIPASASVVTSGDNEIFYLLGRKVSVATDDLRLDRLWREAVARGASPEAVLVELRGEGFPYLLDTQFTGEPIGLAAFLKNALDGHSSWIVYQGRDSRLIDLGRVSASR